MSTAMTTVDNNKALVRALYEDCINTRKLDQLDAIIAPNFIGARGEQGVDEFRTTIETVLTGFPGVRFEIHDLFGEGGGALDLPRQPSGTICRLVAEPGRGHARGQCHLPDSQGQDRAGLAAGGSPWRAAADRRRAAFVCGQPGGGTIVGNVTLV
jgi:hypothetical protein